MMNATRRISLAALAALLLAAHTAPASVVVVRYNMEDGTNSSSSGVSQTEDPDVVNLGFISSATNLTEAGTSNNFWRWDGTLASMANTVDNNVWVISQDQIDQSPGGTSTSFDYLTFTLTGTDMDLAADSWKLVISAGMRNTAATGGGSAQAGFTLQANAGSGLVTIGDAQAVSVPINTGAPTFTDLIYDLSVLGDNRTSVMFRLFATESAASASNVKILFADTISVTADPAVVVAVPAPVALPAGLAMLAVMLLRRRR